MKHGIFLQLTVLLFLLFSLACGSGKRLEKYYTYEDKSVFELIEKLKKNPSDADAAKQLPIAYKVAADKRKEITEGYKSGSPGDRWMNILNQVQVMQQMYDAVKTNPAAAKALPDPWDPMVAIGKVKQNAAKEYYERGLQAMNFDNRTSALEAYDYFSKAQKAVAGYENVARLMQEARERATIKVIVSPVQYYQYSWNYFGFQNDWLQQQMIYDLNAQSFRDVRFFTEQQAASQHVRADRLVELHFTNLYFGNLGTERYTINRSAQVQTGTSKSIPAQPVYKTVTATVYVTRSYMQSNAELECRIYENPTNRNLLLDRFPDNYTWKTESATYKGDRQALTPEDLQMIGNNNNQRPPTRNEIADRLIRNCYSMLLNRIKNGVQFGS